MNHVRSKRAEELIIRAKLAIRAMGSASLAAVPVFKRFIETAKRLDKSRNL